MKIKLIESWYNEETGKSYAKINTDYGYFEAYSQLHEEDKPYESKFAGCQYAETRAVLKYIKKRIQILAYQIQALKNCQKQIEMKVTCSKDSAESRTLRKQIYILQTERKDWQSRFNSISKTLLNSMNTRNDTIEQIRIKSQKKKGE